MEEINKNVSEPGLSEIKVVKKLSAAKALVLLFLAYLSMIFFPLFFREFEKNGNFIFAVIAWVALIFFIVGFLYALKNGTGMVPFVAFTHSVFVTILGFTIGSSDHASKVSLLANNLPMMFLDGIILSIAFFVLAVKLKSAINEGKKNDILRHALFLFFSMIGGPWSIFGAVFLGWGLVGD